MRDYEDCPYCKANDAIAAGVRRVNTPGRTHPGFGDQHVHPFEAHVIDLYDCPYCGAKAGETCYDIRVHRQRKTMDPAFRNQQAARSRKRPRRRR